MNIIANLTSKIKAVIRRDYLIANFKSDAYGNNVVADLLLAFAQKHMPEALAEIKNTHDEVYQNGISASRKRKLFCRCRNRPSRKLISSKVILPNKSLSRKRLQPDHNS